MRARPIAAASPLLACLAAFGAGAPASAQEGPKVTVVVVGDPDDGLRAAARRIEHALHVSSEVSLPVDPGLRAALRGEPAPEEDDGLGRARAHRRALGASEAEDTAGLVALGRMSGAVSVVAVRRRAGAIEAVVLDVAQASYFEGAFAPAETERPSIAAFVAERARVSARGARSARDSSGRAREEGAAPEDRAPTRAQAGPPSRGPAPAAPAEEEEEEGSWLDEWPLILAGALLAGFVIFLALDGGPAEPGPPVLRFVPGGR